MSRNILLTIQYDGSGFSGWQIQPGSRTVQGDIQSCLGRICGAPVKINGTSRTDAGVHALGQRATFSLETGIPVERLKPVMNSMLPGDIKITEAVEMPEDFHARFNSKGKKYIYRIMNLAEKDVFKRNFYYYVDRELDIEKMREAASRIVGTHDFECFMAMGSTPQKTTVRTIYSYEIETAERENGAKEIELAVSGDGFLYNMVRIMTGTLVEVGLGKKKPEDIDRMIETGKRSLAGHTAPPQGLYLAEVFYE